MIFRFLKEAVPEHKECTEHKKIEKAPVPERVIIPLQQHVGAPAEPVVQKGDDVLAGQRIGQSKGFISADIHSSISGKIIDISAQNSHLGIRLNSVVIESDSRDDWVKAEKRKGIDGIKKEELLAIIKDAGIVGMGGAMFPTHVKLNPPPEKKIDTLIINACECEPFLTADHSLLRNFPEEIYRGIQVISRILEPERIIFGIEKNKMDVLPGLDRFFSGDEHLSVMILPSRYPQGAEKTLIKDCLRREVPARGLPMDVGCVVHNVGTFKAVHDAVFLGKPLVERVLTVTGNGIKSPKNVLARIGTLYADLISFCSGFRNKDIKLISGGPMMGVVQSKPDVPVVKGTSGIVAFTGGFLKQEEESECIRCGRCVDNCPMNLMPALIEKCAGQEDYQRAKQLNVLDCVECGLCSYLCPSKRHILHRIKIAKAKILKAGN